MLVSYLMDIYCCTNLKFSLKLQHCLFNNQMSYLMQRRPKDRDQEAIVKEFQKLIAHNSMGDLKD